eukprot:gene9860-biopygen9286
MAGHFLPWSTTAGHFLPWGAVLGMKNTLRGLQDCESREAGSPRNTVCAGRGGGQVESLKPDPGHRAARTLQTAGWGARGCLSTSAVCPAPREHPGQTRPKVLPCKPPPALLYAGNDKNGGPQVLCGRQV